MKKLYWIITVIVGVAVVTIIVIIIILAFTNSVTLVFQAI